MAQSIKHRLIIGSQRSASTYCMLLHSVMYNILSEPWYFAGKNYKKQITPNQKPWCIKTHARDIMNLSVDEIQSQFQDIWILQRKNRKAQILSLALSRNRKFWSTQSIEERDFWRFKVVKLTPTEVEQAMIIIDIQTEFLESFPSDKRVYTEDLHDNIVLDSAIWKIPKDKIVCDKPKLKLWPSSDAILNWDQCLQWIK